MPNQYLFEICDMGRISVISFLVQKNKIQIFFVYFFQVQNQIFDISAESFILTAEKSRINAYFSDFFHKF